ncbi:probable leucine-rich repeat receptor-like serine/threonine-protein kinase At3g14840 isoform X3 [Corylus avellana]|uniref:probable leucine-rich repeat receptor-like serine/threonine-protein kinase At3g14840 isoform X3 n=1 Tax=Corylus avellana TaxID=13451 RepID=UPI00286D2756|nr:probable leucine-rich repeat receptor-like serine/threonine-protein kinase At3g14840 isoform X3 [Corylus avellana]
MMMMARVVPYIGFVVLIFLLLCMEAQAGRLGPTPDDEVEALGEIAQQLGKTDWKMEIDPCINDTSWLTPAPPKSEESVYTNIVWCNCSYPGGACHVENITLTGQDLDGILPPALVKLKYLKIIDLARNYLSGNIPHEWATMQLERMSIAVNNLSGPIPNHLGKMTTLQYLSIENNQFSGTVPPGLGNLLNLEDIFLSANNLTGELPPALARLTKLRQFRISSNNFTGKMPDFFQSWKQLEKLEIQGSGLKGPIPSSISVLKNLTELRISDLLGEGSDFPPLMNMKHMGELDLSFNRLEKQIPEFEGLTLMNTYLTSNLLNGSIPNWIRNSKRSIDLSYNNLTRSPQDTCTGTGLNLFKSFHGQENSTLGVCPEDKPCSQDYYSLHINCGGSSANIGSISYVGDTDLGGPSRFYEAGDNWGFSSTGHFQKADIKNYTTNNVSVLRMHDYKLYMNARISPLSHTYYVQCLANGKYTVRLHFAEIVLRGNKSFYGLGRRIFDVYVQRELKRKDFDIVKEAKGVDTAVIINFTAVSVINKSLEIRFHWAGKGTTATPKRGIYGPLISAISVEANFRPSKWKKNIAVGAVVFSLCVVSIILCILWWKGCFGRRLSREKELKGLDLQTGFFTFKQIRAATNNFEAANKIGEGGFGSVYKGILLDGTIIAVKQLSSKSKQGNREFVNEIGMISALQHPNLVRLYGCCIEGNQLFLVYEYMENNSLARALFGPEEYCLNLDWPTRQKICVGIARGLAFLHEESTIKVVHRDIKTTNVLLDRDLNPKISDFGLAKLDEEGNTHISTRVAGTIGYMAPEYALWGYLTYKADVYSFGVVTLEIVAGKNNMKYRPNENYVCLLDWALVLQRKGNIMELVDPKLGSELNKEEASRMIKVALLCTNPSPALRPTMSAVVSMLEGQTIVDEVTMDPSIYGDEMGFSALRHQFDQLQPVPMSSSGTESLIHSSVATWVGSSSTSGQDIYPVNLDSQ